MNRALSSIAQELRRQGHDYYSYSPYIAQEHAELRRVASRREKRATGLDYSNARSFDPSGQVNFHNR